VLSVRNVAKWSQAVVPAAEDRPQTWQVFSTLAKHLMGLGELPEQAFDDIVLRQYATAATEGGAWEGLDADEVLAKVAGGAGPRRLVDMLLRIGPHGDGFGRRPDGLTLAKLEEAEHGLDLGPLVPRLDAVLNTVSGAIEACPQPMVDDLPRLRARLAAHRRDGALLLIGRRDMRATNSFMHNLPALVKGRDRCTLQVSSADAAQLGIAPKGSARITSRVGSIVAPVEITVDLMPGVVSLPLGWGHDDQASGQRVAKAHPGVNTNLLTDDRLYDEASGTAVLFGTPVTVEPAP
jgi:anaerobic selenocysteine-containing dehydrogenase